VPEARRPRVARSGRASDATEERRRASASQPGDQHLQTSPDRRVAGAQLPQDTAALAVPATRRTAGRASALLLVAVFPGNVHLAADARQIAGTSPKVRRFKAATLVRLPVQWPMIRAALEVARA
jgi:hypothetical protein